MHKTVLLDYIEHTHWLLPTALVTHCHYTHYMPHCTSNLISAPLSLLSATATTSFAIPSWGVPSTSTYWQSLLAKWHEMACTNKYKRNNIQSAHIPITPWVHPVHQSQRTIQENPQAAWLYTLLHCINLLCTISLTRWDTCALPFWNPWSCWPQSREWAVGERTQCHPLPSPGRLALCCQACFQCHGTYGSPHPAQGWKGRKMLGGWRRKLVINVRMSYEVRPTEVWIPCCVYKLDGTSIRHCYQHLVVQHTHVYSPCAPNTTDGFKIMQTINKFYCISLLWLLPL